MLNWKLNKMQLYCLSLPCRYNRPMKWLSEKKTTTPFLLETERKSWVYRSAYGQHSILCCLSAYLWFGIAQKRENGKLCHSLHFPQLSLIFFPSFHSSIRRLQTKWENEHEFQMETKLQLQMSLFSAFLSFFFSLQLRICW